MDTQHLQEFTQVEWYASYWDFEDNIKFFQGFIKNLLLELTGKTTIEKNGVVLDFGKENFDRIIHFSAKLALLLCLALDEKFENLFYF